MVLCLIACAWLGIRIHDEVAALSQLGSGVVQAGGSVQRGFSDAASSVGGVPLVGADLARVLRVAGGDTGGAAARAGLKGEADVMNLADWLGWLTFILFSAVVLVRYIPARIQQVRKLRAAAALLDDAGLS
jgi:hypothetical protein